MVAPRSAFARSRRATGRRERELTTTSAARVAAVVLAAGGSTRMGSPKQLILHDGKTLVARAAGAAVEAGAIPVVVVLGAHASKISPVLSHMHEVRTVINPAWETGLASSLKAGLRAIEGGTWDGVLITLADQPLVDAAVLRGLIAAFGAGSRIAASGHGDAPGVPALFAREHVPALLGLTGDAGAGAWLRSRAQDVTIVPLDGASLDVDTPADAARLADSSSFR